ncbi:putative membrane protein [Motilibacter peucedani]|uniref:Putative membrane protein n=1 Tax=Motilibacter peucedani TaxID=598650 RepID=A0A420XSE4_9ACTN|nr:EamA family transporter [Motilibacter peucedani]RKS77793.1 putative membrane protein [Motilibacter peucedani]
MNSERYPVAVFLALASALVYGTADFCGGLATRRATTVAVVVVSQFAGLLALLALLPVLDGSPTGTDLAWGAAAGLAGSGGLLLFYRALASGVMSMVAPVTAVTAAAVPVLVGLVQGESVTVAALVGIVVALVAVALISAEDGVPSVRALRESDLLPAVLAGAAFGVFFVLLHETSSDSGLWPLVGARSTSVVVVAAGALLARRSLVLPRSSTPLVVLAGVADMGANALYLLATQRGLLAITGVLASLYPVSTVLLAQSVLRERLAGTQLLGLGAAVGAVALIALA